MRLPLVFVRKLSLYHRSMSFTGPRLIQQISVEYVPPFQKEREELSATLPVPFSPLEVLEGLEFFVLCPNGNRIPIETICEEVERDPAGAVLRTIQDRLVLVLEAVRNGKLYWHQAFYCSTGMSSDMPGTWLPFTGLMLETSNKAAETRNERKKSVDAWFAKDEYSKLPPRLPPRPATLTSTLTGTFQSVYGKSFLPEGDDIPTRFGTPSFLYASYTLGGTAFAELNEKAYTVFDGSPLILDPSPLKPCFTDPTRFPIASVPSVNAYIEQNEAIPIYNLFRHLGVKPIGLSKLSVPVEAVNSYDSGMVVASKPVSYSIPSLARYTVLYEYLRQLYIDNKLGKLSSAELPAKIQEQSLPAMVAYLNASNVVFDEAPFRMGIRPGDEVYYGGKRRKVSKRLRRTRRSNPRKTRSRKHRL